MVFPLGLVKKWEAFTLVSTSVVVVNCTSFDAQYPFNRAQIFERDVVWTKYESLIVTKISSHCLVIFIQHYNNVIATRVPRVNIIAYTQDYDDDADDDTYVVHLYDVGDVDVFVNIAYRH